MTTGRRNLAVVGTHRDFLAEMLDGRTGLQPSLITGCASAEDAATSYFRNVLENSNGLVTHAAVAVWPAARGQANRTVFDLEATLTPCAASDAEPGDIDVTIEVRARP